MNLISEKTEILGSNISIWNLDETVSKLISMATTPDLREYICISNVHTVVTGKEDPEFANVTNSAALATADGVPLIWASKLISKNPIHGRASGPDIMKMILERSKENLLKHFFYGATSETLEKLCSTVKAYCPNELIVGKLAPPFRPLVSPDTPLDETELRDCDEINRSGANFVWVGLGAPKQEIWMYRARKHLNPQVLMGVGAAFDFLAGNTKRAPIWMQRSGLEWAYRFAQEPKRLANRYLTTNSKFIFHLSKEIIGQKNAGG